jgi:hypothetical protein
MSRDLFFRKEEFLAEVLVFHSKFVVSGKIKNKEACAHGGAGLGLVYFLLLRPA